MNASGCHVHKLVSDVCLIADGRVLLARYKDTSAYDGEEGWFLPDDYLHHSEHPEEAARRILRDQTGIEGPAPSLGPIESFEGQGYWHLIFHYHASLPSLPSTRAGSNVRDLQWFPLDGLPPAAEVAHAGWAIDTIHALMP